MTGQTPLTSRQLAAMIDHTLLKADATAAQIDQLCREAREYGFYSVCVNSFWVPCAAQKLGGSAVKIAAVIGFPLGAAATKSKACEAREAYQNGAAELDMVLNVGALKSGLDELVLQDIQEVVAAAGGQAVIKVILETGLLSDAEKAKACEIAQKAGAHFVKTSTGFGNGGATVADIRLMRRIVGETMGVKASGGVRDYETALAMIEAGASRIGTSSGIAIVQGGNAAPPPGNY